MEAYAITERCNVSWASRRHAVLGVSPFNSYFTEERLSALAAWAVREFADFHVFIPDEPSAYTLEALGYPAAKARTKARRQANYLHNKVRRALAAVGLSTSEAEQRVIGWTRLMANPAFRREHAMVLARFDADAVFRRACLQASRWVMESRAAASDLTEEVLRCAVRYLLAELPMFTNSTRILGTESSVFCYHEVPTFISELYGDHLSLRVAQGQGFVHLVAPTTSNTSP